MIDSVAVIGSSTVRLAGLAVAFVASTVPSGEPFTDPHGTFEVQFDGVPAVTMDPAGTTTSYLVNVEEDSETVFVLPPTAFGAAPGATAAERVMLFLDGSGDDLEVLANTPTRLGPLPAASFISRITLVDGKRAVLYGVAVVRPGDVSYIVYTDAGGDDADRARQFVESYTARFEPLPVPPPPSTTTTAAASTTTTSSTTTSASASTTSAATTTTTTIPGGVIVSFDGRWSVEFPERADVTLRASSEDGFAYAEYSAVVGDDTLSARVTELPAAFTWDPATAPQIEAERAGATVVDSEVMTVDGTPGVRFTLADADHDTSGDTTEVLLVRTTDQLYRVAYTDGGVSSRTAATAFVDSFQLR